MTYARSFKRPRVEDPILAKAFQQIDDEFTKLFGARFIQSNPPSGMHRVTNLYVNGEGLLVVQYDDTPAP